MHSHRLDPLLEPRSIAVVGASAREGSPGHTLTTMLCDSSYDGDIFLVNPNYTEIHGRQAYPDLEGLPAVPEHVILAVATERLETTLEYAITVGAKAVTLFASTSQERDTSPALRNRLADRARSAGLQVCGANGLGLHSRKP